MSVPVEGMDRQSSWVGGKSDRSGVTGRSGFSQQNASFTSRETADQGVAQLVERLDKLKMEMVVD